MGVSCHPLIFFRRAALALAIFLLSAAPAAGSAPDVLILHSYHVGLRWTDGVMAGMQDVLEGAGEELHLHVEYMDTKRYHDPAYLTRVLDVLLTYKLQRFHFDLVLLSDNDALIFVLRHRDDLFADTPIVFCGVNNYRPEMILGVKGITGVAEFPNFRETFRLALEFHPAARQIVVIGNTRNETDRQNRQLLLQVVPEFADRVEFLFWDDLPAGVLYDRLRQVGPGSIVFINGLVTRENGEPIPFPESTWRMHQTTAAPLYSAWDFFLGEGIVGGRLVSSPRQGELGAELALRVLKGENPDSIPVAINDTNQYMFDYRELRRFGIPEKKLPPGSVVVNRPEPFLTLTPRELAFVIAILAGILFLLAGLAISLLRLRRTQKALQKSEERFRVIADYTCDWEGWAAPDGSLCWVNPSVERVTGYSVAECLAMSDYPLPIVHEDDREEVAQFYASALSSRTSGSNYPFRIRRKDGEVRWMAVSWQPIYNRRGDYLGVRAGVRDLTERQQAEEELRATNNELDAFVRTVSHDLRTPLTPIIGYAEFIRRRYGGLLDETGRFAVEQIEQTGQRMHAMLEDLLALARVGRLELPEEPVDTNLLVREILGHLEAQIAETEARVEIRDLLPLVRVPGVLLAQALENLIGNAVRYGGRFGPIEVGGECHGELARFFVRDHGPGIPEEEKGRVFDLFYRGAAGSTAPGTGVGLATVRRIARRLGGCVRVEDTPGGGSTFWLELETAGCRVKTVRSEE